MIAKPFLLNEDCTGFLRNGSRTELNVSEPAKTLTEAQKMTKVDYAFWVMAVLQIPVIILVTNLLLKDLYARWKRSRQADIVVKDPQTKIKEEYESVEMSRFMYFLIDLCSNPNHFGDCFFLDVIGRPSVSSQRFQCGNNDACRRWSSSSFQNSDHFDDWVDRPVVVPFWWTSGCSTTEWLLGRYLSHSFDFYLSSKCIVGSVWRICVLLRSDQLCWDVVIRSCVYQFVLLG